MTESRAARKVRRLRSCSSRLLNVKKPSALSMKPVGTRRFDLAAGRFFFSATSETLSPRRNVDTRDAEEGLDSTVRAQPPFLEFHSLDLAARAARSTAAESDVRERSDDDSARYKFKLGTRFR